MPDPFGEPGAPDVISSGREEPSAFAARWGRLVRRRRVWVTAACLGLAGAVTAAVLVRPGPAPGPTSSPSVAPVGSPLPVTVPAGGAAGADGVFARGVADGRAWRLAVQDIAAPGYRCIPAITLNGTDADPVYPAPGNSAVVTLGTPEADIGFAFVQVPGHVAGVLDGRGRRLPVVTAKACGLRYRLTGFAYRLTSPPKITAAGFTLPLISEPSASAPQTVGMWNNVGPTSSDNAAGTIAAGQTWSIMVTFSVAGDCYDFSSAEPAAVPEVDVCGPVSTPDGVETIMALPLALSFPPTGRPAPTGYAVQVSPATARLRATLSDGSVQLVTPRVVDGRRYAAFQVPSPLRLKQLSWLDATGWPFATTTAVPRYGFRQFQP
jgi:hypothetical protein